MSNTPHVLKETDGFLVLFKPATMPTVPDTTGDDSAVDWAEKYMGGPVFVVHRLDRPVSGVLVLGKTKRDAAHLSRQFSEKVAQKTYWAVVRGELPEASGTLRHFLRKNKNDKSLLAEEGGKDVREALLEYREVAKGTHYTCVEINLQTGRHHQIRAQMSAIGCPVKGDVRYGDRRPNPDRSIHLHSRKITFYDPRFGLRVEVEAPAPAEDALWAMFDAPVLS